MNLADEIEGAGVPRGRKFGDYYLVSEDGEVWSRSRAYWKKLTPVKCHNGYAKLTLRIGGRVKTLRLNRVVAEAYYGPPPFSGAVARHLDDNKDNNRVSNIAWGTVSENALDAVRNGVSTAAENGKKSARYGEEIASAKLSNADAQEIKRLLSVGERVAEIAGRFSVSKDTVYCIKWGKAWRHV